MKFTFKTLFCRALFLVLAGLWRIAQHWWVQVQGSGTRGHDFSLYNVLAPRWENYKDLVSRNWNSSSNWTPGVLREKIFMLFVWILNRMEEKSRRLGWEKLEFPFYSSFFVAGGFRVDGSQFAVNCLIVWFFSAYSDPDYSQTPSSWSTFCTKPSLAVPVSPHCSQLHA